MSAPTAKQLASRQVRRLRTIRKQLLDMSCQWDGLDQFNMGELERVADLCEEVAVTMVDSKNDEDTLV
jgi:hypothetical protein